MAGGTADENSWQTRSQFRTPLFVLSIIIKPICLITILIRTRLNRDFLFNSLPLTVSIEQRERRRRRERGRKEMATEHSYSNRIITFWLSMETNCGWMCSELIEWKRMISFRSNQIKCQKFHSSCLVFLITWRKQIKVAEQTNPRFWNIVLYWNFSHPWPGFF